MWLGNAADLAAGEPEDQASPAEHVNPAPEPLKRDEPEEEKPAVTTAKSEIELPSPTPKPTATADTYAKAGSNGHTTPEANSKASAPADTKENARGQSFP